MATPSGVHEIAGKSQRVLIPGGPLVNDFTVVLSESRDGSLWVGNFGDGLWQVRDARNPNSWKPRLFTAADGLGSDQTVRSLNQDKDGTMWIGTFGGGLSAYRNGMFLRYTAHDGLLSDNISHVEDDGKGYLWLSTTCEESAASHKQQLRDFSAGPNPRVDAGQLWPRRTDFEVRRPLPDIPRAAAVPGPMTGVCGSPRAEGWRPLIPLRRKRRKRAARRTDCPDRSKWQSTMNPSTWAAP